MTTIQIVIIVIIVYNSKRRKTKKFNRAFDQFETQNIKIPQKNYSFTPIITETTNMDM